MMTEFKEDPPWDWKGSLFVFLIIMGVNFLFLSMIQLFMLTATGWEFDLTGKLVTSGSLYGVWLGTIITEFIILGITIFAAVYFYRGKVQHFNFKLPSKKHFLIAIGGVFIAYFLASIGGKLQEIITGTDPNQNIYIAFFETSNIFEVVIWITIMMLVVAVSEEIFARGFVQKGFHNTCRSKKLPIVIGIIIPSLLFALLHLDIYRFIPLFFVGLVLGCVYYFTADNSMASAITHFLYKSIGIILYFQPA